MYPNHVRVACYSNLRLKYSEYDITCVPCQRAKDPVIELAEAIDFFMIMAKHEIVPEKGIELTEEDHESWGERGIVCRIQHGHPKPQRVYAALTCYRWIDSHPAFVWEFLKIYRCGLGLSAFQILPYLVAKYVVNCNHSFINSMSVPTLYGSGVASYVKNPLIGVATKIFFDKADKRGISTCEPNIYVNATISSIARDLMELAANPKTSNPDVYEVSEPKDVLNPRFKPLYEIPNITKEQVSEVLESLFTGGK